MAARQVSVQPCSFWPSRIAWWKPLWPALTPKPEAVGKNGNLGTLQATQKWCHSNVTVAQHDEIFDNIANTISSILGCVEMVLELLSHSQVQHVRQVRQVQLTFLLTLNSRSQQHISATGRCLASSTNSFGWFGGAILCSTVHGMVRWTKDGVGSVDMTMLIQKGKNLTA